MSRHNCWNCDYRLEGDPSRCPRCGMPLAGLDAPRQPAAAAAAGAAPAKAKSRKAGTKADAGTQSRPQQKAEIVPPGAPRRSATVRMATGAGKGLRLAATGAGRGLLASLGLARKSLATGTALSVKTVKLVGSAAGGVASGVRSGTRLIAYRPQRPNRVLDGDILHRENVRTIADVAERLLRDAREENARLAARFAALEARFTTDRIAGKPAATAGEAAASSPRAPAARKTGSARTSRSTTSRAERSPRREPTAGARPVITLEAKAEPANAAEPLAEASAAPATTVAPASEVRPTGRRRSARSSG